MSAKREAPENLEKAIAAHDLLIPLIPYVSIGPAICVLEDEIKAAGITRSDLKVDPGVDRLYAVKVVDEVHAKGGKVALSGSRFPSY